jgi:hypothetical protein
VLDWGFKNGFYPWLLRGLTPVVKLKWLFDCEKEYGELKAAEAMPLLGFENKEIWGITWILEILTRWFIRFYDKIGFWETSSSILLIGDKGGNLLLYGFTNKFCPPRLLNTFLFGLGSSWAKLGKSLGCLIKSLKFNPLALLLLTKGLLIMFLVGDENVLLFDSYNFWDYFFDGLCSDNGLLMGNYKSSSALFFSTISEFYWPIEAISLLYLTLQGV